MERKGLGLLGKSPPDWRDHPLPRLALPVDLPLAVDLRKERATPKIFDQKQLGSCTANAANAVAQYVERKDGDPDWDRLSRLYTYYYAREKIGLVNEDSGAFIRDAFAVLHERGAPREVFWPYDADFRLEPSIALQPRAEQHRVLEYMSIPDGDGLAMRSCLTAGYPFAFGFAVYDTFWEIGPDGIWSGERGGIDGYHAVAAWGYDFTPGALGFDQGGWIVRNSWGSEWGHEGYYYVPRAYMVSEAFDCWTIRKVTR